MFKKLSDLPKLMPNALYEMLPQGIMVVVVQEEYHDSLQARREWSISLARIAKFRPLKT